MYSVSPYPKLPMHVSSNTMPPGHRVMVCQASARGEWRPPAIGKQPGAATRGGEGREALVHLASAPVCHLCHARLAQTGFALPTLPSCTPNVTAGNMAALCRAMGLVRGVRPAARLQGAWSSASVVVGKQESSTWASGKVPLVQQDRMHDSLHETCKWGATPAYGR